MYKRIYIFLFLYTTINCFALCFIFFCMWCKSVSEKNHVWHMKVICNTSIGRWPAFTVVVVLLFFYHVLVYLFWPNIRWKLKLVFFFHWYANNDSVYDIAERINIIFMTKTYQSINICGYSSIEGKSWMFFFILSKYMIAYNYIETDSKDGKWEHCTENWCKN